MNPVAALHMANGRNIVIEFLPEPVPNTVNSSICTASRGHLDHHATKRIMPGNWTGVSYTASGKKECRYLIPNKSELNSGVVPLDFHPGAVCMGGYGGVGLAGYGFFSPLRDCPDHRGVHLVFGRVLESMDELYRLGKAETVSVTDLSIEGVEVDRSVEPEVIERVELELHGEIYPESVRVREPELLECWK